MGELELNDKQKEALHEFEAAYQKLRESGVGLIAFRDDSRIVGLKVYSTEKLNDTLYAENADYENDYIREGLKPVTQELQAVEPFDVDDIMFEEGYKLYANFK